MPEYTIRPVAELTDDEIDGVRGLVVAATESDGVAPLDEEGQLGLRARGSHLLAELVGSTGRTTVGYAHRALPDHTDAETSGDVVVHPDHRRRGLGRRLVEGLLGLAPDAPLRIWAHRDRPESQAFAARLGFANARGLWRMRATLAEVPTIDPPAEVSIRTFRPGTDDAAWVSLNAAAFATHPEQGRWTADDLRQRMAEPWFDADGFFLAERNGKVVGFHWTKVQQSDSAIGEIYVLGIHPDAHRLGLGKALASVGLRYLRDRGLTHAMLFVESDNVAAIRLYERLGFSHTESDVMYRHPGID